MPGNPTRILHVVTHRRWIADDLATAAAADPELRDLTVWHDLGFDLPDFERGDVIWAPMEWMARARRALGETGRSLLPLADPGPAFLSRFHESVLGRRVGVATVGQVVAGDGPDEGFYKPANCKVDFVPAAWRTRIEFVAAAAAANFPTTSDVLWADTRLEFTEEHRTFVRHGQVVTSSPYLRHLPDGPTLWHEGMRSAFDAEARTFAQSALDALIGTGPLPPAFVLDVGLLTDGRWVVIETNPVWSSGQYGADLAEVIRCLIAANNPTQADGFEWIPDPYLVDRAATQRPLGQHSSSSVR